MKYNSITTRVKHQYLSTKALGTAPWYECMTFKSKFVDNYSTYSWYPNVQQITDIVITKAKCIDWYNENVTNGYYADADGKRGINVPYFDDENLDCRNMIMCSMTFADYFMSPAHKQKTVKNITQYSYPSNSWCFFGNGVIERVENMKVTGPRYGMFEGAGRSMKSIKNLNLGNTYTNQQMFNSWANTGPLTELSWSNNSLSTNISNLKSLPREQLIGLMNGLSKVTSTQTLTLGSTLLAKLTDEDKKIATDKGWTLA
jgi:hypothetical protein